MHATFTVLALEYCDGISHASAASSSARGNSVSQGFILPDKKRMFLRNPGSDVRFPHVLAPEGSCTVGIDVHELARHLKSEGYGGKIKVVGFYLDQVGRIYKSRGWEFDIEEWL